MDLRIGHANANGTSALALCFIALEVRVTLQHLGLASLTIVVRDDSRHRSLGTVGPAKGVVGNGASRGDNSGSLDRVALRALYDVHVVIDTHRTILSCIGGTFTQDCFVEAAEVFHIRLLGVTSAFRDLTQRLHVNHFGS